MMRPAIALLPFGTCLAAVLTPAALAQPAYTQEGGANAYRSEIVRAAADTKPGTRAELHKWMKCTARKHIASARAITLGDGRAFENAVNSGAIFDASCHTGRGIRFAGLAFLDPIAEFVLARDFEPSDEVDFTSSGKAVKDAILVEMESAKVDQSDQRRNKLKRQLMGLCLLERDDQQATALLATRPDSEAESTAVATLAKSIDSCLDKDYRAEITFDELRGAVATVRYRLLHNAANGKNDA